MAETYTNPDDADNVVDWDTNVPLPPIQPGATDRPPTNEGWNTANTWQQPTTVRLGVRLSFSPGSIEPSPGGPSGPPFFLTVRAPSAAPPGACREVKESLVQGVVVGWSRIARYPNFRTSRTICRTSPQKPHISPTFIEVNVGIWIAWLIPERPLSS